MRDPHVERLFFKLVTDDSVSYNDPEPLTHENGSFRATLDKGILTFEMKEHHATAESAQGAVDGFLRAWELDVDLNAGRPIWSFEFQNADVIDRNPVPPGSTILADGGALCGIASVVRAHVMRAAYPRPPSYFAASQDVRTMWLRFRQYVEGREPLPSMAYACLKVIEGEGKRGRERACEAYKIEPHVLDTLGRLSSTKGGPAEARKPAHGGRNAPLSMEEKNWMVEAIKQLIRRKGEYDHDPNSVRCRITMSGLPSL